MSQAWLVAVFSALILRSLLTLTSNQQICWGCEGGGEVSIATLYYLHFHLFLLSPSVGGAVGCGLRL